MRLFIVTFPFGGAKPVIANKKTVLRKSQSICRDELQALSMRLKVGNLFSAYTCIVPLNFAVNTIENLCQFVSCNAYTNAVRSFSWILPFTVLSFLVQFN